MDAAGYPEQSKIFCAMSLLPVRWFKLHACIVSIWVLQANQMNTAAEKTIKIIAVPMDLGASRRGTDMGPSALRIAGLGAAISRLGYRLAREEDIAVPAMETHSNEDTNARFKPQVLSVCTKLGERVHEIMADGQFPLVIGGDHSIAMGTVAGAAAHFRDRGEEMGLIWFDAHGDMNVPGVSPSGNIHGMPLAHLLGRG